MNIKQIRCIALSLLSVAISGLALCQASGTMSIYAAEHDADLAGSYGIEIFCCFDDQEKTDHSREDYQANSFLLTDEATGYYAQAEYSKKAGGYVVSGFTGDKASAAVFRCGQDRETPGKLAILGLTKGTYILTQEETAGGYWVLRDSVAIYISVSNAKVDEYDVEMVTGSNSTYLVPLTIINAKGFKFPSVYSSTWAMFVANGGILIISACSFIIVICCSFLFIFRRKIKKQNHSK